MTKSVADRVKDRMPRPVRCDCCGSPRVSLENRTLMGLQSKGSWPLIWYCSERFCGAMVGTHEGTDIPLGLMASRDTREARYWAHKAVDPLWKRGAMTRAEVYDWMARVLNLPSELAHISMLDEKQCYALVEHAKKHVPDTRGRPQHWKQKTRKRRR